MVTRVAETCRRLTVFVMQYKILVNVCDAIVNDIQVPMFQRSLLPPFSVLSKKRSCTEKIVYYVEEGHGGQWE
jgi:hypothetical protein